MLGDLKEKRMKKNSLRDLYDTNKYTNIHFMRERKGRNKYWKK